VLKRSEKHGDEPLSLLLVEGDTEKVFYERVKGQCLKDLRRVKLEQIKGLFNVNKKILAKIKGKYNNEIVRVYCCLDRESRYARTPGFDLKLIKVELKRSGAKNVLSINAIIATRMIESWFFYDLGNIYKFLRVPRAQRRANAYQPVEGYGVDDLKRLFRRYKKKYAEGKDARNFINCLDVERITRGCNELRKGINLIQSRAGDLTNHLFRGKRQVK